MSASTSVSTGLYIYAFLDVSTGTPTVPAELVGIDSAPIHIQTHRSIAIAMSSIESKKIRPQRKNLAAHQEVVTYLAKHYDMLPVAFGLVADDLDQVTKLMISHEAVLAEQIERVAGHLEMAVNLRWAVPNVVQYFVERYTELSEIRQAIASGSASRDEQIAAGQLLESLISAERQEHTTRFTEVLRNVCKEIEVQPAKDEADCMRLACLIERTSEDKFTQAVYQAASLFSDDFAVNFNGPWPPYSFVNLALSLEQM